MKQKLFAVLLVTLLVLAGGCKKTVQAPVPGSINSIDAYAFRVTADAGAAIHSVKTWEVCSDASFPPTVTFDNVTEKCDPTATTFPAAARPFLLKAEQSYNLALDSGKAYHAGGSNDATGLTAALTQLSTDIANMLTKAGGK